MARDKKYFEPGTLDQTRRNIGEINKEEAARTLTVSRTERRFRILAAISRFLAVQRLQIIACQQRSQTMIAAQA